MFVGWIVCCCTLYKNAMVVSCLLAMYTCFIVRVCSYGVIHAFFVSYLYYPKKFCVVIVCCFFHVFVLFVYYTTFFTSILSWLKWLFRNKSLICLCLPGCDQVIIKCRYFCKLHTRAFHAWMFVCLFVTVSSQVCVLFVKGCWLFSVIGLW